MPIQTCLLITDHTTHRYFDSVYLLAQHLNALPDVEVLVVSLGDPYNQRALEEQSATMKAVMPDSEFCFENRTRYFAQNCRYISASCVDFVLIRLIPFDATQLLLLKQFFPLAHFFNSPQGIIKTESKAFLRKLQAHTPFIEECSNLAQLKELRKARPLVLKPLYGYGGKENILLGPDYCVEHGEQLSLVALYQRLAPRFEQGEQWLAMEYLPDARKGDKRIVVVNGEVIGASLRLPKGDGWICNVSNGGQSVATHVSEREAEMLKEVCQVLAAQGIEIFGTDTLLDQQGERVLSEINTLCIGGFYTLHNVLNDKQAIVKAANALQRVMLENTHLKAAV